MIAGSGHGCGSRGMDQMTASSGTNSTDRLQVRCRFKAGANVDLDVLDISPGGCMVNKARWSAETGDRVLIKLPGLSFQPATIAWIEDDLAGIAFEQILHEAVLLHLQASVATSAA